MIFFFFIEIILLHKRSSLDKEKHSKGLAIYPITIKIICFFLLFLLSPHNYSTSLCIYSLNILLKIKQKYQKDKVLSFFLSCFITHLRNNRCVDLILLKSFLFYQYTKKNLLINSKLNVLIWLCL